MAGFIKLYRDLQDNPIWNDKPFSKGQAWVDIMFRCNHICKKVIGYSDVNWVLRGQFISSNYKLAEAWGWSESSVRKFIKLLELEQMVMTSAHSKFTLFEVTKYCVYQAVDTVEADDFTNAQKTRRKRAAHAQKTPNKNDKNNKNEKKLIIYSTEFEKFFDIYPNQFDKEQTYKNWNKVLKSTTIETVMKALNNYLQSVKDNETESKFIYRSTNFIGEKAYYKGFIDYIKPKEKLKPKTIQFKPQQQENFQQRQYDDDYFNNLYVNTGVKK